MEKVWRFLAFSSLLAIVKTQDFQKFQNLTAEGEARDKKFLNLFSVVKFPNDVCAGGTKNGTCFTAEECQNIGGTNDGTCASGFGVCCTVTLSCGGSSSQNCTYIEQSATTSLTTNPCNYMIDKVSSDVCRIRFDFTTFSIESPTTGTALGTNAAITTFEATGDCTGDTFTITSPGGTAPPVICGFNTGQHMIVDASDAGHVASFHLSTSTTTSRSWTIKVTQYACGVDFKGGPPGCLQYFTGTSGTVASFNFLTTSATVGSTATHLSNQYYSMCFRREASNCFLCFTPVVTDSTSITAQASYGLGVGTSITVNSAIDTQCIADYLGIANGEAIASTTANANLATSGTYRQCGKFFSTINAIIISTSVCTRTRPFRIVFYADSDELGADTVANGEQNMAPGGIVGFNLAYTQTTC